MPNRFDVSMPTLQLPDSEQDRLAQILDGFLVAAENGSPMTPDELLKQHPADADVLRGYLSGLRLLQAAGADSQTPVLPHLNGTRPAALGQVVGDFRLVREIGRGGMGVVYEAVQISLRRRVALKILPFTVANDAKQISRFRNEAQAAAQLHHPHIVPVFAVGEDSGIHYYAMQLIGGESLAAMLIELRKDHSSPADATTAPLNTRTVGNPAAKRPQRGARALVSPVSYAKLTAVQTCEHIRSVARLAAEAAEALHAAHDDGIIHRDIKPSNLLVDGGGKLWVTDFGLARCRENAGLTQSGDVLGTMRYMSPEQALGRATLIDHRTDIYSLGVTLYELATLRHPAAGLSDLQIFFDRGRSRCKPLRSWNRHIPADFQTIVMKAMSEFPHERYATAKELADDLQRFLDGKPIQASPPSVWNRAAKWTKRHRVTVAAVALVAFASLAVSSLLLARKNIETAQAYRRSNESLRQAHDVLDRFATRLVDQLATIPGADGVRHELLEDCLGLYTQLEKQTPGDRSLDADRALAFRKMGSLTAKLGDKQRALDAHLKAHGIWEERLAHDPNDAGSQHNLARSNNDIGLLLADLGRNSEALEALTKARDALHALRADDPTSRELAVDLAATSCNFGLVLKQSGKSHDAAQRFREAIALQEQLLVTVPTDEAALRTLAASYNNLASLQQSADGDGGAAEFEKAIAIQRKLVETQPINRNYQSDLARTYNNLGYLSSRRKHWQRAEACYGNAIRIQEHLAQASPLAAIYRRDLAVSYNNLGMVLSQRQRLPEAKAAFQKALDLQQALLAVHPHDVQLLSDQGGVLNNLGKLLEQQGLEGEAEQAFRQAILFQTKAIDAAPKTLAFRALLSKHYFNCAGNLRRQGKFTEAAQITLQRKKLWPDDPQRLFAVAQELAAAARQVPAGTAGDVNSKDQCADSAVATLREAIAAGLPKESLRDGALSPLYGTAAYQQLLAETTVERSAASMKQERIPVN